MDIKMIVTDLDGTLLKTDKTVSEYTKNILSQCRDADIKVVYATARGGSAERLVSDTFVDGKIRMNGAIAKIGDDVVYDRLIPHQIDSEKIFMVELTQDDVFFIENQLPDCLYFVMSREGNGFGMIMHKDATKAKAVSALADFWGIKQSEIAAFGDDLNDMDMLSFAGVSVAIGNAIDKVKNIANYVCLDNDSDGVAKWLEENVL